MSWRNRYEIKSIPTNTVTDGHLNGEEKAYDDLMSLERKVLHNGISLWLGSSVKHEHFVNETFIHQIHLTD